MSVPSVLTRESLDEATAAAGLPAMEWTPCNGEVGAQRPGWWWTPPLSTDTAEVQAMGRRICATTTGLEYVAAALPLGLGVALAVGLIGGDQ